MKIFGPLATIIFVIFPLLGYAAEFKLYCSYETDRNGWIPQDARYSFDPKEKSATAYDPLIDYVHKAPIIANYSERRDGRFRLKWKLKLPAKVERSLDNSVYRNYETFRTITYTAFIDLEAQTVHLKTSLGRPAEGKGVCKVSK